MTAPNPGRELRALAPLRTATCKWCGAEFQTTSAAAEYCPPAEGKNWSACYQRARRAQKRDKLVAADKRGGGRG